MRRLWGGAIRIGGDGRGRALDDIFIERLWRSLKYGGICLNEYENAPELQEGLRWWFGFYDEERPHPALPGGTTPRGRMKRTSFFEPRPELLFFSPFGP